jgi:hypothetical protein
MYTLKPHLWLIRVLGVILPRRLRADWRQEWEAELRYRETLLAEWDRLDWRNKLDLLRRSTSAFAVASGCCWRWRAAICCGRSGRRGSTPVILT